MINVPLWLVVAIPWLLLGLFISYKAKWFISEADPSPFENESWVIATILLAPAVFIYDLINLVFIKPWK